MITSDGWLDWAGRIPGPSDKVYSQPNTAELYIPHSAVGYYPGWESRLFSRERGSDGRYTPYAAASVHGWIAYDGTVIQHYPFTASCWASGSAHPNTKGIAFENEGGPPGSENEPLTEAQLQANVRIILDIGSWKGRDLTYWERPTNDADLNATLYEHRECKRFGSSPTACPSSRIPWDEVLWRVQHGSVGAVGAGDPVPFSDLAFAPGLDGLVRVGDYQILYNNGVPIFRWGGPPDGMGRFAKNFGGQWVWLRNDNGIAYWSSEDGD